jgi:periplasmic divalent cation tolerance protein
MSHLLIHCAFPDLASARAAATTIIAERLAACVNLIPGCESHYEWEGKLTTSSEILTLWKTTSVCWEAFSQRLRQVHPYTTPEIIATEVAAGDPRYLAWVTAQTGNPTSPA